MPLSILRTCTWVFVVAASIALGGCKQEDNRKVENSVFRVVAAVPTPQGLGMSTGTAFKVHGPATVATNHHVVDGAEAIFLVFWQDGKFEALEARLDYGDKARDIAILKAIRPIPGEPLPLAAYSPEAGSEAWAFGFPGAADMVFGGVRTVDQFLKKLTADPAMSVPTRTSGTVSGERKREKVSYIQHQVPINPGNSGGPLVDACGTVVGMNTLVALNANSIFGAIGTREVIEMMRLRSLDAKTAPSKCWVVLEPRYRNYATIGMGGLVLLLAGLAWLTRMVLVRGVRNVSVKLATRLGARGGAPSRVIEIMPIPLPVGADQAAIAGAMPPRADARHAATPAATPAPKLAPAPRHARVQARLVPVDGGNPIALPLLPGGVKLIVGREKGCDILLEEPTISRRHCRLEMDAAGNFSVFDLGSSSGTRVNGARVTSGPVRARDRIGIGALEFQLEVAIDAGQAEAPRAPAGPAARGGATWVLSASDERGQFVRFTLDCASAPRTWVIGRAAEATDLVIANSTVSAQHAALRCQPGGRLEIQDKGSSNGTTLNGQRVGEAWMPIDASSRLKFGACEIKLTHG